MAETDPKHGLHAVARRLQDLSDVAHGLDGHLGVAGAVAQEEAVVLRLVEQVVPGHDVDAGTALHEAADLVDLETAVHGAYAGEPSGVHGVGSLRWGNERLKVFYKSCAGCHYITLVETCATTFSLLGSSCLMESGRLSLTTILPNMVPCSLQIIFSCSSEIEEDRIARWEPDLLSQSPGVNAADSDNPVVRQPRVKRLGVVPV